MHAEPETSYVYRPILAQRGFKHPKAAQQFLLVCVHTIHRETVHMHEEKCACISLRRSLQLFDLSCVIRVYC